MAKLIVFSGAGLSAESGLATFRNSPTGLWENHSLDVVCNYLTWRKNYDLVHDFYSMRRAQLATALPNSAHHMIARWQRQYDTIILTQNVDDLLERAGCKDVIHLHGFLPELTCEACGHVWTVAHAPWATADRCPQCHSRAEVKPNVVFFNQDAPRYSDLYATLAAMQYDDVIVVVGTSGAVIDIDGLLEDRPGYKIFNALHPAELRAIYHEHMMQPATAAFPIIDTILQQRLARR